MNHINHYSLKNEININNKFFLFELMCEIFLRKNLEGC